MFFCLLRLLFLYSCVFRLFLRSLPSILGYFNINLFLIHNILFIFIQQHLLPLFFLIHSLFPSLLIHLLLLFRFGLITILREGNFALHLIIILKDISNQLTIGNIKAALLDPNGLDEPLLAILIALLFLLDLPVCLLNMGQPLNHPPRPHSRAQNVDACIGSHLQTDARQFLSIHVEIFILKLRKDNIPWGYQ